MATFEKESTGTQLEVHFPFVCLEDTRTIEILGLGCTLLCLYSEPHVLIAACRTYVGSGGRAENGVHLFFVDKCCATDVLPEANLASIVRGYRK